MKVSITRASNDCKEECVAHITKDDFYNFLEGLYEKEHKNLIVDFCPWNDNYDIEVMIYDYYIE